MEPNGRAVEVRSLVKRFGPVTALDHVDLDVGPSEVAALVGPNGAGKSTLLRILATTVLPDGGTARVCGHDVVTDVAAVRRLVGVSLADERAWYWRLSGQDNLEFFAVLYGLGRPEARRRSAELLERFGLADAADRRFDGYSSGMRARLSLCRALLLSPPLLLLDEPTRTLDPIAAADFRGLVRALASDGGHAVLFATHDLHEASAQPGRVFLIAQGRLQATAPAGTPPGELERLLLQAVERP